MKSTANRAHHTIDIAPKPYREETPRTKRRKEQRKAATAAKKQRIRERIAANQRLVRA
jgi:hypothetical protein